jgi:hypothetical protein
MLPERFKYIHPIVFLGALILLAVALPFSLFLMSISQIILILNFILEGNFHDKWKKFISNKNALFITSIFLILIPGVFYSEDTQEALKQVRINLPFLILPFILSTSPPLSQKNLHKIILIYISAVLAASIYCAATGLPAWLNGSLTDIREISVFVSHIRFSMMIAFAALLCIWIFKNSEKLLPYIIKYSLIIAFFILIVFLFILQSVTGIGIFLFISVLYFFKFLYAKFNSARFIGFILFIVLLSFLISKRANNAFIEYSTPKEAIFEPRPDTTKNGNPYKHDCSVVENGNFVLAYLSEKEIKETWNKRSKVPVDSLDGKGNPIYFTIIRYLNSKDLHKDEEGINQLSESDIRFIENGIANVNYTGFWGIKMRFYQFLWEFDFYKRGGDDGSGYTILMKKEFWKNTLAVIKQHPFVGVGTGDAKLVTQQQYRKSNSWLDEKWQLTAHNYYLYVALIAGIPGFLIFIVSFFYPVLSHKNYTYFPLSALVLISAIAMLTEDVLTTQAGVTFVAYFYCLFLFSRPKEK